MAEYFSSRTKEDVAEVSRKVGFIDDKETLGLGMAWPVDDDYKPSITTGDYKLDIESDDPNVEAALSYKTDFGWRIYKSKEIQLHAGLDISVPDDENVDVSSVLDDGLIYEIKDGKDGAVIVDYPKSVLHVR